MTTPIEHAAETIAQAQNVPFVGTKQRKIAEALAAAGLIATEPTVKPGRDAVLAALLSVEAGPSTNALADAVLAILPGKTEAQVRAEALRDAQQVIAGEDSIDWARTASGTTVRLSYAMGLLDDLIADEDAGK